MPRRCALVPALLLALLAGCADLPDFDAAGGGGATGRPAAGYPRILPLEALLARAGGAAVDARLQASVSARAAGLRARAAALRRPVIEPETRARMAAASRRLHGG